MSPCLWTPQDGEADDYWDTACSNSFMFDSDGPSDNRFVFCPFCGRPIKIGGTQ